MGAVNMWRILVDKREKHTRLLSFSRRLRQRVTRVQTLEDRRLLAASLQPTRSDHLTVHPVSSHYADGGWLSRSERIHAVMKANGSPVIDLSNNSPGDQVARLTMLPRQNPVDFDPFGERGVANERVTVDPAATYRLSGTAWHSTLNNLLKVEYAAVDGDGLRIEPTHVNRFAGAEDTFLLFALEPGDAEMVVTDATGWSNEFGSPASTRALAFYQYASSGGDAFEDFTYTRNIVGSKTQAAWESGTIEYDATFGAYRIQLAAPWPGPAMGVGEAVRNAVIDEGTFRLDASLSDRIHPSESRTTTGDTPNAQEVAFEVMIGGTAFDPEASSTTAIVPGTESLIITSNHELRSAEFRRASDMIDGRLATATFDGDTRVISSVSLEVIQSDSVIPVEPGQSLDVRVTAHRITGGSLEKHSIGLIAIDSAGQPIVHPETGETLIPVLLDQGWLSSTPQILAAESVQLPPGTIGVRAAARLNEAVFDDDAAVALQSFQISNSGFESVVPNEANQYQVTLDVLANDDVPDSATLLSVLGTEFGTATIAGNQIVYQAPAHFVGHDRLKYAVYDSVANETYVEDVSVSILGTGVDATPELRELLDANAEMEIPAAPPIANDDRPGLGEYVIARGQVLNGDGAAQQAVLHNDAGRFGRNPLDGASKAAWLVEPPAHGSLSMNSDGTFTYVPDEAFMGVDRFRYAVFDGFRVDSATARIRVLADTEELVLDRLRQLTRATHSYHSAFRSLPLGQSQPGRDENGVPYLSWRVHLLPFLGYQNLYNQFVLTEPYDSANNLPLLDQMPDLFRVGVGDTDSNMTRIQRLMEAESSPGNQQPSVGSGTFDDVIRFRDYLDGLSQTLMYVQTGADLAVPWTAPQDTVVDINDPLASLGQITTESVLVATADGAAFRMPASIDADTFLSMATRSASSDIIVDVLSKRRQWAFESGGQVAVDSFSASRDYQNMERIALGLHNFHSSFKRLPPNRATGNLDDNGDSRLSWRVHLLPFIDQQDLFSRFNLDEPWDSPNNLPLLNEMPDLFRSVGDLSDSNTTRIQVLDTFGTIMGTNADGTFRESRFRDVLDGLENTIMALEVGADKAVQWTKPDDLPFDWSDPIASLGDFSGQESIRLLLGDGSQLNVPTEIDGQTFIHLATQGGRYFVDGVLLEDQAPLDAATLRRLYRDLNLSSDGQRGDSNHAKQVMLAVHNFQSSYRQLPALNDPDYFDENGHPKVSWRVWLLPFLGQEELWNQFRKDEPWDSPHNLPLLEFMPDVFRSSGDAWDSTTTRFLGVNAAEESLMQTGGTMHGASRDGDPGPYNGRKFRDALDGLSNTIMFVESGPEKAVPWSQPGDIPFDPLDPLGPLGELEETFLVALLDGATFRLPRTVDRDVFGSFLLIADKQEYPYAAPAVTRDITLQDDGTLARIDVRRGDLGIDWNDAETLDVIVGDPDLVEVFPAQLNVHSIPLLTTDRWDPVDYDSVSEITVRFKAGAAMSGLRATTITVGDLVYDVNVVDADAPVAGAPSVQQIVINDGQDDRSQLTKVTVVFDSTVDHASLDNALLFLNDATQQTIGYTVDAVDVIGQTFAEIRFLNGASTHALVGQTTLADGTYHLHFNAGAVLGSNGVEMSQDAVFGDEATDRFFRLFGDSDGDGDVDGRDYGRFGLTFLKSASNAAFDAAFDFDGDGDVDGRDYGQFGLRFLTSVN